MFPQTMYDDAEVSADANADDDADDDADVDDDADDDADDGHLQVDILLFPEDGLSGFEFPKAHLAQPFLQTVRW